MPNAFIQIILLYLVLINLLTFILSWIDKRAAIAGKQRVSESKLILLSIFGGSLGMFLSMRIFRHKTKKYKFSIGIPIIMLIQIGAVIYFNNRV